MIPNFEDLFEKWKQAEPQYTWLKNTSPEFHEAIKHVAKYWFMKGRTVEIKDLEERQQNIGGK